MKEILAVKRNGKEYVFITNLFENGELKKLSNETIDEMIRILMSHFDYEDECEEVKENESIEY